MWALSVEHATVGVGQAGTLLTVPVVGSTSRESGNGRACQFCGMGVATWP